MNKTIIKVVRGMLWVGASLTLLLVLIIVLIRMPSVQQVIVGKLETYLKQTLQTEVSVGRAYVSFPKNIEIESFYLEDRSGDTLVYFQSLKIDTDLWDLMDNKINLQEVEIDHLLGSIISYHNDSTNFDYVIDSFAKSDRKDSLERTSSWEFAIGDVSLTQTKVRYQDHESKLDVSTKWHLFETQFELVDFTKNIYLVDQISLKGADISLLSEPDTSPIQSSKERSSTPFDLQINRLMIDHSKLDYQTPEMNIGAQIGSFMLQTDHLDISTLSIDANLLALENSQFDIQRKLASNANDSTKSSITPLITLKQLSLKNNKFNYDIVETERLLQGFDPSHIEVSAFNADVQNIAISSEIKADIHLLAFSESDRFELKQLAGKLVLTPTLLALQDFVLVTHNSEVEFALNTNYASLGSLLSNNTLLELKIKPSKIYFQDLAYFNPPLFDRLQLKFKSLQIEGGVSGSLAAIELSKLKVSAGQNTSLIASGTLRNMMSIRDLAFENTVLQLTTTRRDLKNILPDSLLPSGITIPPHLALSARVDGSMAQIAGKAALSSTYGDLALEASYRRIDKVPVYDFYTKTKSFNFGKLLQLEGVFNQVKLDLKAQGKGTTLETADLNLKGKVNYIDYNGYTYDEIIIDAGLRNRIAEGQLAIDDTNLAFKLDGSVDMTDKNYHYKTSLHILKAHLDALKFTRTPLSIKGDLVTDFKTEDFKTLDGRFGIRNFSAHNGIESYKVDSLLFASIEHDGTTDISIDSDIMEGHFNGNIDFTALPLVIGHHIDQYYDMGSVQDSSTVEVQFTFDLHLKEPELLTEIILPDLSEFNPGPLNGSFNSKTDQLLIDMNIHHMIYSGVTIDSSHLNVLSDAKTLSSQLTVNKISSDNTVLNHLNILGTLNDNRLKSSLSVADSSLRTKYLIAGVFESLPDGYSLQLDHDSLMLNYELWSVTQENSVIFHSNNVEIKDFTISNDEQKISFSKNGQADSLLRMTFSSFDLRSVSSAVQKQDGFLKGIMNGFVDVSLPPNAFSFNTHLAIADFHYLDEKWGDIQLKLTNEQQQIYRGSINIQSAMNEALISGVYHLDHAEILDADISITRFDLATLEPLISGGLDSLSGTISGEASLNGTFSKPAINGTFHVADSWLNPSFLNNGLSIKKETIHIKDSKARFDDFIITDRKNNKATIDGSIELEDFNFYRLNLSLKTEDFLVLNTTDKDNDLFYGQLNINGNATIKGSSLRPDISMNLEVSENSNITYLVPESEYTTLNHENIVKFVNVDQSEVEAPKASMGDSLNFEGIKLSANIGIKDNSSMKIIIDPITQDKLVVQGNAALTLRINRKGDLELAGRYDLTKGTYDFSFYKLVKRTFNIEKGSSITWTGDPFEAQLDVKASHQVEAPPIDLVVNQITDQQELNKYRQKLPFLVYLDIEGKLFEPAISFEIDMPENKRNAYNGIVYARIRDLNSRESDLNKQVFALLILKRFIADNPLQSEGGYNLEDNARRSVSRILSDQLNRFTEHINGMNIDFNLASYQDFSSGNTQNTTQLELGISKTLFNDRLEVNVAGNVNLEGQQQQNFSDYVGDLVLEYKLTDDGRLRVTGFRRSDFDIISGEITETGAGIIYVRDYNSFKEIFKSRHAK